MIIFKNANIITMSEGAPSIGRGFIAVEPPFIRHVGGHGEQDAFAEYGAAEQIVDLTGKTVFPGLVNCHHHITLHHVLQDRPRPMDTASITLLAARTALENLRRGVTAVRVVGNRADIHIALRNAIESGLVPGPRMRVSGDTICMSYGQAYSGCCTADSIGSLVSAVRKQISDGADLIKIIGSHDDLWRAGRAEIPVPWMSQEEMRAAVQTAHEAGLPATIHANGLPCIERAVNAGFDCIEHGIYLNTACARQMRERGIVLDPTLSGYRQNASLKWGKGKRAVGRYQILWETHRETVLNAIKQQVEITAGTDGLGDVVEEMELLAELGLPMRKVLESATTAAARLMRMENQIGSIEKGKYADFIVLPSDPRENLSSLREVETTVLGGVSFSPAKLDILLPEVDYIGDYSNFKK